MSIQVHLAVAARSRPLALSLTSGQEHDIPQVARLLADHQPEYVIADKACDSDEFVQQITDPRLPLRLLRSVFTGTSLIDIPDLHVLADSPGLPTKPADCRARHPRSRPKVATHAAKPTSG
jgi:hypothetical protein